MRGLLEEQGIEVVGSAGSGDDALAQIADLRPDVALIDIDLGRESGLALARRVTGFSDQTSPHVILISTHDEKAFAELIEQSPALGFLSKTQLSAATIHRMLDTATGGRCQSDGRRGT